MNEQPAIFVECGADLPWVKDSKFTFTRKHYMTPQQVDEFRQKYNNAGVYMTMMQYINPVWYQNDKKKWLINAGESLKYGDFYLDFDYPLQTDDDFDKIKFDVSVAMRYLKLILAVEPDQVNLYFSGQKGIHLTVDAAVLGLQPHYSLNMIYKEIFNDIKKYCLHDTMDPKMYDDKRMFRMVNSFNIKGQRYKIPVTYQELTNMSLQDIRNLAMSPRQLRKPPPMLSQRAKLALEKYIKTWTDRANSRKEFSGRMRKLEELPICITTMLDKTFRETIDGRNNACAALASFFMQQGMEREEALARLVLWGEENCVPSLPSREVETTVHSVFNGQYRYGCETFKAASGVCDKVNCPLFRGKAIG
ncbi:hypothetical protein GZH47_33750 (plasmid) [Paenibacillus rhizovicinus]|uniref:Primase C-terminal 1 domain-containing protein n=1 Tax=Paenibacillus rhizovicinus TaxID=2704463 RepID=A0A6C0PBG5_9BACL|nr:primase C-terminal domain-containing protein [Paenibacillus rhizovicinus]QHW35858.1 hypothetical protein GZH47_33750 [Paenibacillus rhizovicinus]